MPEGDSLWRVAHGLQGLVGGRVIRFYSPLPELAEVAPHGRRVTRVEARGKNLLIWFDDEQALYTHLRMQGSWHRHRGADAWVSAWRRPLRQARVALAVLPAEPCGEDGTARSVGDTLSEQTVCANGTAHSADGTANSADGTAHSEDGTTCGEDVTACGEYGTTPSVFADRWRPGAPEAHAKLPPSARVAVCFNAPDVEWLTAWQVRHHPVLSRLGPDLLAEPPDIDEMVERLLAEPDRPIGEAIMDQRRVAGIGNVYKSELLFIERLDPFAPIGALGAEAVRRLLETAATWMRRNLGPGPRRTRWDMSRQRTWVYDRSGRPCGACGARVRMTRQGAHGRSTYFCPRCQGVTGPPGVAAPARPAASRGRSRRRGRRPLVRGPAE